MGISTPTKAPRRLTAPVRARREVEMAPEPLRPGRRPGRGVYTFICPFFDKRIAIAAASRGEAEQRARRMLDRVRCGTKGMMLLKFSPY
jgi:hypothetical protein